MDFDAAFVREDLRKVSANLDRIVLLAREYESENLRLKVENAELAARNHSLAVEAIRASHGEEPTHETWIKVRVIDEVFRQARSPLHVIDHTLTDLRKRLVASLIERKVIRG